MTDVLRQEDTYIQIEPWLSEEYISSKVGSPTERGKTCFYPRNYSTPGNCVSTNQNSQEISSMMLQTFLSGDTEEEEECTIMADLKNSSLDRVNMNCPTDDNLGTVY